MLSQLKSDIASLHNRMESMQDKFSIEYLNLLVMRKALTIRYNTLLVK